MKKGDLVRKIDLQKKGSVLLHNLTDEIDGHNHMKFGWTGATPSYSIEPDPLNPGKLAVVLGEDYETHIDGVVNWAVGVCASIQLPEGRIFTTQDFVGDGWVIIAEAPEDTVSLAQKAGEMTIEELRANIERLRSMRVRPIPKRGGRVNPSPPVDSLSSALSKLTPEQLAKVKARLGL